MREHRLLRGRANREAVVLDRHLALGCLPEGEGARRRSLREVVDVARDHVPRPRLVEPTRPLRDRLVLEVVHLDVADAVELLEVGHCLVHEPGILGVDVRDPLAQERHADRLPVLGEERHLALVRLRLPEDVPRLVHAGDVLFDLVRPPCDAGGVDGVGNGVARLAIVERVDELRPDVLLEVRDVVEVERLDQLAGNADIERVRRDLHHVGRDRSGGKPLESGVDVVERRVLDFDVVLGPELREELLVEVGGIVVDGERPAVSGSSPDAMGSSQRGRVTRLSGLASGRPPGPTSSPPAPVLSSTLVELPQAASRGPAAEKAAAAPALRSRKLRLLRESSRSFGWCVIRVSGALLSSSSSKLLIPNPPLILKSLSALVARLGPAGRARLRSSRRSADRITIALVRSSGISGSSRVFWTARPSMSAASSAAISSGSSPANSPLALPIRDDRRDLGAPAPIELLAGDARARVAQGSGPQLHPQPPVARAARGRAVRPRPASSAARRGSW